MAFERRLERTLVGLVCHALLEPLGRQARTFLLELRVTVNYYFMERNVLKNNHSTPPVLFLKFQAFSEDSALATRPNVMPSLILTDQLPCLILHIEFITVFQKRKAR